MALVHVLDVIRDVGQVVKKCPNGTLQAAYIRAARQLMTESRWYRSALTGATVAGTSVYALGSDPYEEVIGIRAMAYTQPNGQQRPVIVGDPTMWPMNAPPGCPLSYAYVPEGQFALYPAPDAVYPLLVTLILTPKAGQNQLDDRILAKWDQGIQAGALAYLLRLKEPWQDMQEAARQDKVFRSAISNAKAEVQKEFQAMPQRATPRRFIV